MRKDRAGELELTSPPLMSISKYGDREWIHLKYVLHRRKYVAHLLIITG